MKGLFQTMTNEKRDRLVELVQDALFQHAHYVGKERQRALEVETEAEHSEIYESIKTLQEFIADYIIADGWIRPPCKVGNVVWIIEKNAVERATVNKVEITGTSEFRITLKKLNLVGKYVYFQLEPKELGITIFIGENAKDQAEQKLKEMRGING